MKKKWTRREFSKLAALQLGAASLSPTLGHGASGGQTTSQPMAGEPIQSAYSPATGQWEISWPERLSQHDVVYLSPPEDPTLGLPIGNGDMGALLWSTDNGLVVAINKCDTWDDDSPGPADGWGRKREDRYTSLRQCGRLNIDFGCPAFNLLYLQDFEARLELASAIASFRAVTPFATVTTRSYASAESRVLVLHCKLSGTEPYGPQVRLDRWGSRTFAHWYSQVNRDPRIGLNGTETSIERGRMVIHQKLRTLSFVLAAQVLPEGHSVEPRKLHGRAAAVDLPGAEQTEFTVFITAVTSENDPDPLSAAHHILDGAVAEREESIRTRHQEQWKKFWAVSMVDLPEKYLENIWHTNLYLANSSSRGAYPPHFCNGLWGWDRDFVPWNWYFHWNEQWYAWPLAAANHSELTAPYFRYRRAQLTHAMEYAQQQMNKPGAFYADVSDRQGYNNFGVNHNHTPGAQIALDFWRHYAYTGDEEFLRDDAWPVIREVARFNASCLALGADGRYHISQTHAYEGAPLFDDTITDLAMIQALFPVAVLVGKKMGHKEVEVRQWQEMFDKLAPFHLLELEPSEYERKGTELVHRAGLAPGKQLASRKVFAVGRDSSGKWIRNRYAGREDTGYYGIPDPEIAPVFPAGVIGLADRPKELFRAAVTQLRLHPKTVPDPTLLCKTGSMAGGGGLCMGWCPYPIALARLGLAEELASELVNSVSTWQFYPQGFGHYGPYYVFKRNQNFRWNLNQARDASSPLPADQAPKFPFPSWPFRHFDNEAMPIAACAMNEMLIQSYDGTIRICPAVPADWHVRFDLAAAGGFRVSAEQRNGRIIFVSLESRLGRPCRLQHPWPSEDDLVCLDMTSGNKPQRVEYSKEGTGAAREIRWETITGHRYLLVRRETDLKTWNITRETPARRDAPRKLKQTILGRERLF
ncbi:MAG TPA: hypothetical protein VMW54_07655 [Terriglobia bacterium]|nr:hypothetical protein [Terriglobia bacterium]